MRLRLFCVYGVGSKHTLIQCRRASCAQLALPAGGAEASGRVWKPWRSPRRAPPVPIRVAESTRRPRPPIIRGVQGGRPISQARSWPGATGGAKRQVVRYRAAPFLPLALFADKERGADADERV